MKHGKRPTVRQKKLMAEKRLNPDNWLVRHKKPELMRPMLAQFPHSCLFGICKAASLAAPCKNNCTKIFRRLGSASSKRANFLQEKAKAELIVCLLTSILTYYCGKFAFLNRMEFGFLMPDTPEAMHVVHRYSDKTVRVIRKEAEER